MKLIIHFLLLSSLSILIRAEDSDQIRKAILKTIEKTNGTTSTGIKFHVNGELGKGSFSIVWKVDYKGHTIAFKLMVKKFMFTTEMGAYSCLNAIETPEIEKRGIANIHCHGSRIFSPYFGIGMTLFGESLEERWQRQNKNISELSILLICKRGVEILEYLNERRIIHNDIKPSNIFFRGAEVFLGDFNSAADDEMEDRLRAHTVEFASSGFYANKKRTPMDDLESFVFSLWSVAGIKRDKVNSTSTELKPEGATLAANKESGTAKPKMNAKCDGFKSVRVRDAFKVIAADEMLKKAHAPNYDRMKKVLSKAIEDMHKGKSGSPQFEWLTGQV